MVFAYDFLIIPLPYGVRMVFAYDSSCNLQLFF